MNTDNLKPGSLPERLLPTQTPTSDTVWGLGFGEGSIFNPDFLAINPEVGFRSRFSGSGWGFRDLGPKI